MNEFILFIILLLAVTSFLVINYNYSRKKLSLYLTIIILISYILSFRNINILGMNLNANTITYATILPTIYFYNEKNKIKDVKDLLFSNFIILIITLFFLMLITGYKPSVNDNIAIHIQNTFGNNFMILIMYPITLILSEYLSLYFYNKLKDIYENNILTIIISCSIITAIDIIIYNIIVYIFKLSITNIIFIITLTYIIRLIVIFIYSIIINNLLPKKKVKR